MSATAMTIIVCMGRWLPDAQGRLGQAAMELYAERGYEQTTVAEIAARAGLTERTFFRHFADKREVLFAGGQALREIIVSGVTGAPASCSPLAAVAAGFEAGAEVLQEGSEFSRRRQAIIAANPELQERELIKLAGYALAIAQALRERGVAEPTASLTAEAGVAIFRVAFERWTGGSEQRQLPELLHESLAALKAVVAEAAS
jgi:AcrR family transcriptional regulator